MIRSKGFLFLMLYCMLCCSMVFAQTPQYSYTAGTSSNAFPFNSVTNKTQWLYLGSNFALPQASAKIRSVYVRAVTTLPVASHTGVMFKLTQSTITSFPGTSFLVISDTALYAQSVTVPVPNTGAWLKYPLQKPFVYDTVQSLIVEASAAGINAGFNVGGGTGATNRRLRGAIADVTGTRDAILADFGFDIVQNVMNNAAVEALSAPSGSFCPGSQPVRVKIYNNGINKINSVTVNWEVDGLPQPSFSVTNPLDTFGSSKISDTTITLGNISFTANTARTIRVWTSLPNGIADPYTSDDTLTISLKPSLSGTYTIGASGNYTTFASAIADLNNLGTCGTVTFNVDAGSSFTENPLFITNYGKWGGPVTFRKNGAGANPVIYGVRGIGSSDAVVTISGGRNITFDGIDVTDSISNSSNTLRMDFGYRIRNLHSLSGATDNIIKNCRVQMNRANSGSTGILQTGAGTDIEVAGPAGNNNRNRYENVKVENTYRGIQLIGIAAFPDSGCVITSTGGDTTIVGADIPNDIGTVNTTVIPFGINLTNQKDCEVSYTIVRNISHPATAGVQGISVNNETAATNYGTVRIFNNRIYNLSRITSTSATAGIIHAIKIDVALNASAKVYNNIIYGLTMVNPSTAATLALVRGISHGDATGTGTAEYYNNSVSLNVPTLNPTSACLWKAGAGTITVRNNIFSNTSPAQTGNAKHYAVYLSAGNLVSSHNVLYTANANGFTGFAGADRTSLPLFAAGSSVSALPVDGNEAGSSSANPNFTSATDLTFAGATPAAQSGTPVAGITTDFNGTVRNATNPTIGAYETAQPQLDSSAPVITNVLITSGGNPTVYATIKDNSNTAFSPSVNLWYRAGTSGPFTPFGPDSIPSGSINGTYKWSTTLSSLAIGNYQFYISVRDAVAPGVNIAFNPVQLTTFTGFNPADPANYIANPDAAANTRTFIKTQSLVPGTYTVGPSGNFANLTAVANALNSAEVSGDLVFELQSNYSGAAGEIFPVTFNEFISTGGSWKVVIRPGAGVTGMETSGYPASGALITLNGAKRITFDGRPGGTGTASEWTIRSKRTSTANTPAVLFINGAQRDTLKYMTIESGNTTASSGTILFSTTINSTANSFNGVSNCSIRDRADSSAVPLAGIYSEGTAGFVNEANSFRNNNIFNWTTSGIQVTATGNGNDWNISGNSFYSTLVTSPVTAQTAVRFVPGTSSIRNTISNNSIGGQLPGAAGAPWINAGSIAWRGIVIATGTADSSFVNNNTISNISLTGTSTGTYAAIEATSGRVSIHHNMIGDLNTLNSISSSLSGTHLNITITGSTVTNIYNNTLSNITSTGTPNAVAHRGISHNGSTGTAIIIRNNVIRNLSTLSTNTSGQFAAMMGIYTTVTNTNQLIANNVISGLSSNGGTAGALTTKCIGILTGNSGSGGFISGNRIYDLAHTGSNPAAMMIGIRVFSGTSWTVDNNMISLGTGTDSVLVCGIEDSSSAAQVNVYHNSVFINGSTTTSSINSFALYKQLNSTMNARNNIFYNARTGTGSNYATGAVNTTAGLYKANYNVLNSTDPLKTGLWGNTAYDLAGLRTISLQDTSSLQTPVTFTSATDLHLAGASLGDFSLAGAPIAGIATDFDGQARHPGFPYIGADESLTNPLPLKLTSFSAKRSGGDVNIGWVTASENNVSHFEIERSVNGKRFEFAGEVKAAGNSSASQSYTFIDNAAFRKAGAATLYYRLRSVDNDRSSDISSIVSVNMSQENEAGITAYPNPFSDYISFEVNAVSDAMASVNVADITGKTVYSATIPVRAGDRTISATQLNILNAGIYFISVEMNGETHTAKMIRQ